MKLFSLAYACALFIFTFPPGLMAQKNQGHTTGKTSIARGPELFSDLIFTEIPGAPTLGLPQLIMGATGPVKSEGLGWAAPAVFDWDDDGKKDLLIGEFGSGNEAGRPVGNFIRIYSNEGSDDRPVFSDIFDYAQGRSDINNGTPLSINTWCCMGFIPGIVDLDGDGIKDIVAGQFDPGDVMWFRGSDKGFLQGERLDQSADPVKIIYDRTNNTKATTDITGNAYWKYSAVSFGDLDGDGDEDMIIGGSKLRISDNVGTRNAPRFGFRTILMDVNDHPLMVLHDGNDNIDSSGTSQHVSNGPFVPYVFDWDQDGVPDLFVTTSYAVKDEALITYFRGKRTASGIRFDPGKLLISAKNKKKAFPGSNPHLFVTDWNNDGVNDLVVGMNIATMNGKFNDELSWGWEVESGTYKYNPGNYGAGLLRHINKQIATAKHFQDSTGLSDEALKKRNMLGSKTVYKHYFINESYRQLSHKGYIYVLLGTKKN